MENNENWKISFLISNQAKIAQKVIFAQSEDIKTVKSILWQIRYGKPSIRLLRKSFAETKTYYFECLRNFQHFKVLFFEYQDEFSVEISVVACETWEVIDLLNYHFWNSF